MEFDQQHLSFKIKIIFDHFLKQKKQNINDTPPLIPVFQMKKVAYLFNQQLTNYQFSKDHFMKPRRLKMTQSLIESFQLDQHLMIINSKEATKEEIMHFHHPHYVKYLDTWVNPRSHQNTDQSPLKYRESFIKDLTIASIFKVNQNTDCPGFQGLDKYCALAAGGSIDAADTIITGLSDIAINWGGGYHHAKKSQASGFCYVNDIVLCILKLLEVYQRVLYLDIDVHHGDGVQEAFYNTNRVMTVSFHQFSEGFFPQTGALHNIGEGVGRYFSVNIPLKRGMGDDSYGQLFKCIMSRVMASFVPDVLVVQCGADSLAEDKLGCFNMSIKGHAKCLNYMKSFNVPMILLGGGGYTIENVARCWAYQTGQMLGIQLPNKIPESDPLYYYYLKDDLKLHFDVDKSKHNDNTFQELSNIVQTVTENLRNSQLRPSVQIHHPYEKFVNKQTIGDEESQPSKYSKKTHIIRK